MNNAGNTIPRQSLSYYINQTEKALSALLPPLRQQILQALQHQQGQTAAQLAYYCHSDAERITAHIDKLVKHQYVDAIRVDTKICYFLINTRLLRVNAALRNFSER